jgi:mannosyltransferase
MAPGQQPQVTQPSAVLEPAATAAGTRNAAAARSLRPDWTVVLPGVVTLAVVLWGLAAPSYWKDEAATLSAEDRSLPQLWHLLAHTDAVHGLYYFMLWPVCHFWGTREFETRFPSAVAMALAACGVAVIGRRIRSRRAGLYAGLVFAVLPMVTIRGHDARPYAFETAAAVLATYLLVRAAQDPRARCWSGYGLSLVLLGYLHMFGLVLIAAHAIALIPASRLTAPRRGEDPRPDAALQPALSPRRLMTRWAISVVAAMAVLVPLLYLGYQQRDAISWLPRPTWSDVPSLAIQLAGTTAMLAVIAVLAALGAVRADWPDNFPRVARRPAGSPRALAMWSGRRERLLSLLAVTWVVLPPAILMVASVAFSPVYEVMYVAFCLPAVALLAGAGLASIGQPLRITALVVLATLSLPIQLALREPPAGGPLRAAATILARHERPGDAVFYVGWVPDWSITYPAGFGHLRDISLGVTAARANRLIGLEPSTVVMQRRLCSVERLWVVQMDRWKQPVISLADFRLAENLHTGDMKMRLYVRVRPPSCHTRPLHV